MNQELVCWRCGDSIAQLPVPLARLAACPSCQAELHVCRMCQFYQPGLSNDCREPVAEDVKDKERANFCGYFAEQANAYQANPNQATLAAQKQLEALFNERADRPTNEKTQSEPSEGLEELFKR